ncbi:MAG TPA: hypothetical protein VNJ12_07475 [Candidatus Dormibacteraeota bacterium]|nr:hypothetical protein [Candidatus Dormibacteraeota bacterium]
MRLEQLFDKTRDGMVAFELAQLEELSGRMERAIDWYKRAWHRFRRADWKQKAEEALGRHGISTPLPAEEPLPEHDDVSSLTAATAESSAEFPDELGPETHRAAVPDQAAEAPEQESIPQPGAEAESNVAPALEGGEIQAHAAGPQKNGEAPDRPRRRRHRGGRGRGHRKRTVEGAPKAEAGPEAGAQPPVVPQPSIDPEPHAPAEPAEPLPAREPLPPVHVYRRSEPALASEIKTLEAKLRQLLASQPHSLADSNELPANPGVFLVSDLDLTTTYYLEACGNMRSAMSQFITGRRGRQGSVRSKLAKYLGINDSQASRYLKQHCVARWIDLEEADSEALGHFARAVLRPELMEGSD